MVTNAQGATQLDCKEVAPIEAKGDFLALCETVTQIQKDTLVTPVENIVSRCEKARKHFPNQTNLLHYLEFQARLQGPQPNTALAHLQALETSALGEHTQDMWDAHWTQQKRLPPNTKSISKKLLKHHPELVARYVAENPKDLSAKSLGNICTTLTRKWPHLPTTQDLEKSQLCHPKKLSNGHKIQRLDNLLKSSFPLKAAAEAKILLAADSGLSKKQREKVNLLWIETMVRGNEVSKGLEHAQKLTAKHPNSGVYWGKYAWALAKAGQLEKAVGIRQQQEQKAKQTSQKEEGCFFAAFGMYELNQYQKANEHWRRCFSDYPKGKWANALTWYIPFTHLLNQEPKKAITFWESRRLRKNKASARKRFFLAFAYEQNGEHEKSKPIFTALAKSYPLDYYGVLAREQIGLPPLKGTPLAPDALELKAKEALPHLNTTQRIWLALGEAQLFRKSLSVAQIKKNRAAFYGLYQKLGDYHRPWRRAGKITPRYKATKGVMSSSPTWRATYAMPHHKLVAQASDATQMAPEMIYAIMRTESGFMQQAISPVGALGLMQLMPYTAAFVADSLKTPLPPRNELLAPKGSIWLGSHFLSILKKTFKNDFLVAAAYNGSPKAVHSWVTSFGNLPIPLFVERIPYRETRQYVKKVMTTKAIYQAFNGGEVALEFPERVPNIGKEIPRIETVDTQLN